MEKIFKVLNRNLDKVVHFLGGYLIASFFIVPLEGFVVATFIGGLKELLWDLKLKKGTPDKFDFLATSLGGLLWVVREFIFK